MRIAASWTYPGGDACADFFTGYLRACDPDVPEDARVLEIGCCEFDWITPAHTCWPSMTLTGIDWRRGQDVLEPDLFEPETFDLIVSISTVEHIGLGHYGDPEDPNGDMLAALHASRWLKPGGWLLFDVPYDPAGYRVQGTKCRVYDDRALQNRFYILRGAIPVAYCAATETRTLIEKPSVSCQPFHYVGLGWQKGA